MASKGGKGAKRATDKNDGAEWARKKLKDGADGRPGSIQELLKKIGTLRDSVKSVKETTQ